LKLLHFSDLHLGVDNYGSIESRTGLSSRVGDFLRVLDVIITDAVEGSYDAVLFSGDAFKNRDPSPTLQREFAKRIVRLARAGVPIVMIVGNHDLPNVQTRATPVEIYQVLSIPGVQVIRMIDRVDIETRSGRLQIVAVPWVTRSMLLAKDSYRELSDQEIEREVARLISEAVSSLAAELDPGIPAVLMAHVSLQGASLGSEQSIMLGRDVTVGLDDLSARRFDYVALGHIHKHQQPGTVPPAVYAGSPERIDFGEERESKGYVSVTITPSAGGERKTEWRFIETPARPFLTLRVTASGDDPMTTVRRELERRSRDIDGAIVRCYVHVDRGREKSVNPHDVRRTIQDLGASYVAHVVVESDTVTRGREELDRDTARDSLQMLERWVEQRKYDPAQRTRVLERGRDMIQRRAADQKRRSGSHG
jgi:DNA repair protein SbcD/Mre11